MADRSISIAIEARVQGFIAGMRTAKQSVDDFGNRMQGFARENEQHLDRVGKAGLIMGGGLLAGALAAVKSFAEFDKAMSEVQASTHETEGNMDLLREAAVNAGADTAFSAKEAAGAIDELSKAGVSTADILSGGLKGALSLASAGSLDVGQAAEFAASAMTQFKLSGKDIPHIADLLAAGAGKAQGSVQDMGLALSYAGVPAKGLGVSIEETTGAIALFASNGIIGEKAGTALRGMFVSMTKPTKETKERMDELGISFFDSNEKFIGLEKVAGVLQDRLAGLGDETRNAALAQIFGTEALGAAQALYAGGPDKVKEWTEAVNASGYAAVTASIKQDNLAGDLEKLGGSFDSVLIKGGGAAAEALRGVVQGIEGLVDAVGNIPGPMLQFSVGAAGVIGAVALLGGGLLTALPKLVEFKDSLDQIAPKGSKAAGAIGKVGKAAGIAVGAMLALQAASAIFTEKDTKSAEDFGQALLKVSKAGELAKSSDLDSLFNSWDKFAGEGPDIRDLAGAVKEVVNPHIPAGLQDTLDGMFSWTGSAKNDLGQVRDRFKGLGEEMGSLAKNGSADAAARSFNLLTKEFQKNGQGAKEALQQVPGYKDALLGLATASGQTLTDQELLDFAMGKVPASMQPAATAVETYTSKVGNALPITDDMAKALEDVGLSASGAVTDIDKFGDSLFKAGLLSLSSSDAAISYQDAIDKMTESVTKNGTTLDLNTEAGRANQSAFNGIAKAAITSAEAHAAETLATQGSSAAQADLQASLGQSYQDLITAAGQLGITGDAADTLARKALGVPKNVNLDAWIADHASSELDKIKGKAEGLDGKRVTVGIYTTEYFDSVDRRSAPTVVDPNKMGGHYATGGRVYGPGTTTSDSIPTWLSKDEYVIKASVAQAIGYQNLDRLNGGDTQPLKPMGYEYAPASAPAAAPAAMGGFSPAPAAMGDVYVQNPFTGEYLLAQVDHRVGAGLNNVASTVGGRSR